MVTYEVCDFTSLSSPSARRTFGLTPEISASSSVGDGRQQIRWRAKETRLCSTENKTRRENGNERDKERCVKTPHEENKREKKKLQPRKTLTGIHSTYSLVAVFVLSGSLILVIFLDGRNSSLLRRRLRCFFLRLLLFFLTPVFFFVIRVRFLAFPSRLGLNCCLPLACRFGLGCGCSFGRDSAFGCGFPLSGACCSPVWVFELNTGLFVLFA